jgi:hypothetical protein
MEHVPAPEKVIATKTELGTLYIVTQSGVYRLNSVRNVLEKLPFETDRYVVVKSHASEEVEQADLIKG